MWGVGCGVWGVGRWGSGVMGKWGDGESGETTSCAFVAGEKWEGGGISTNTLKP
ncbi:hypothetical protein [Microcystis aeruginosa]|uniref:Uncharacterized protein n=1 Tax=Microcystis aeruginosa FD4 TaxID=2686288 RepID=A0A857D0M1_MICAE|nr:hypothetical protein [Microcystis aeruginosa]QGZ88929.1 hypothetical protein GQR42_04230 [Microcystis aeruginosa FD4]